MLHPRGLSAVLTVVVSAVLALPGSAQTQFDELGVLRVPPHGEHTRALVFGDLDGDGDLDLVAGNYRGPNRLYLNDGTGRFHSAPGFPTADTSLTTSVALGDFDGDGDLDVVFGNDSGEQNRLYVNDGSAGFVDGTVAHMPFDHDRTRSVASGDLDGDGDLDIVCSTWVGQNRIYVNDGAGSFVDGTPGRLPAVQTVSSSVVLGDVDADGDLDLVVGNHGVASNQLFLNDGAGVFTDASASRLPVSLDSTNALALGDVDGDGDPDLVLANGGYGGHPQNQVWLNDGTGTFHDVTASAMPRDLDTSYGLALGDVDGDGDLDIAFANEVRDTLYINDGTGSFHDERERLGNDNVETRAAAFADIDGDGDPDLVFGNSRENPYLAGVRNRMLLNLLRQVDARSQPVIGQAWQLDFYARFAPPHTTGFALPLLSGGTAAIDLPPAGTLGIDPARMLALPLVFVPQPAGAASVTIPVPNDLRLVGESVHAQALLIQYPSNLFLTNVTHHVIQ